MAWGSKLRKGIALVRTLVRKMTKRSFWRKVLEKWKEMLGIIRQEGIGSVPEWIKQKLFRLYANLRYEQQYGTEWHPSANGRVPFDAEYQLDMDFSGRQTDIKALAFYLPQFHTFPENDAWWGKGFTEWVNTRACTEPRFSGHYQPREPHADIGYYDLSDFETMRKQIALARAHGIYGFCYYYYWFSGKRLMEKPVDQLLEHPEVDFPFCLCWANENWTRAWDGMNKDILIQQNYADGDEELFISDIARYIRDPRYIRIQGRPLIIVYNPGQIPKCKTVFDRWRACAKEKGLGEILIWVCATANHSVKSLGIQDAVDAEVEFPPHNMWLEQFTIRDLDLHGRSAMIFDYERLANYMVDRLGRDENEGPVPVMHACMLGWDNAARRKDNWCTFYGFSLEKYYQWLRAVVLHTRKNYSKDERFIFINAWNEWAEGTYLEPDAKCGYAYINTTSKALFDLPYHMDICMMESQSPQLLPADFEQEGRTRIAVQIHLFYLDTLDEMIDQLGNIPYRYDCYISTDTQVKKAEIEKQFQMRGTQSKLEVKVFPNRGRDVRPMLCQLGKCLDQYDYIGHFHSKKTKTGDYGNEWRTYCFRHLLGSKEYLQRLFLLFEEDSKLGLVFPPTFPPLMKQAEWGGNFEETKKLLQQMHCDVPLPQEPVFPVGNMFFARSQAVKAVLKRMPVDVFPEEQGQVNATPAHCVERCWVYAAAASGYGYRYVYNDLAGEMKPCSRKRVILYVHYSADQKVADTDWRMLRALREQSEKLVVISNSPLLENEVAKLRELSADVIQRPNRGYDFSAWHDAMEQIGYDVLAEYDELILTNNSMLGPIHSLDHVFAEMDERTCDFWGMTLFEYCADGSYLNLPDIPEHLQSYFLVFHREVVQSRAFQDFFHRVEEEQELKQVIARYESQLTGVLERAGFRYEPYILETRYLGRMLGRGDLLYAKPWIYLLLRMPMIKKKAYGTMEDEDALILRRMLEQISTQRPMAAATVAKKK